MKRTLEYFTFVFLAGFSLMTCSATEESDLTTNAINAYTHGDYQVAIKLFTKLIQIKATDAYLGRGYAYFKLGEYDKALSDLDDAIQRRPSATAFDSIGDVYLHIGEYEKAIKNYTQAIDRSPSNGYFYIDRANACLLIHQFNVAKVDCSTAMLIFNDITDTNNPLDLAYCVKGQIYAAEHNPECYTYFSKAIQMKPNDSLPYMYRAKASFDDGKIDQAINDFKMVIRLSPANAYVHKCLADAEIKKGNYFNAIDQCNEAIKIDSNCFSAFDQLAWIQAACPDPKIRDGKTALVNAKKACDLAAWKNAQSLETLAAAYAETGDFKQAVAWEQKAIDLGLKDSKERLELYKQNRPFRFEASLGK